MVVVGAVLIPVGIALVLVAVGVLVVRASWPRTRGTLSVDGLTAPVGIIRDEYGVPHVYAAVPLDAFFGQGFVHGQDRFFQMDLQRRMGLGRLAEIFGRQAVPADRMNRRLGLHRSVAADLEHLDGRTRQVLDAYAAGVNAALARQRRPLEYRLLRARPQPWTPLDSLAWAKVMQWELSLDWYQTLGREKIARAVGPARAADLFPDCAADDFAGVETSAGAGSIAAPAPDGLGSNAWVVGGSRTASGKPILANDLHLPFAMPGVGYEVALHAAGFECAGLSFPGLFGVLSGHNGEIAWGLANTRARTQDLYAERVDPQTPDRYQVGDRYEPFTTLVERIDVRGAAEPEEFTVRLSRHGPILSDEESIGEADQVLALRAMPLAAPSTAMTALRLLGEARSWEDFTAALRCWDAPMATFVYADVHGNIGSYCAGRVPVRACRAAATPLPGWNDTGEWTGTIPFEALPRAFNPAEDIIVAANAKPAGDDYPYFLAPDWCTPNRERRILELLVSKRVLTTEAMHDIQLDTCSLMARRFTPFLLAVPAASPAARDAQAVLRTWDCRMLAGSAAAGIYQVSLRMLVSELVSAWLGPELTAFYLTREQVYCAFVDRLLDQPESPWWTRDGSSRDARIASSMEHAVRWWTAQRGPDPASWTWGSEHQAEFRHPLYGRLPLLRRFGNGRVGPVSGDPQTPFATGFLDTLTAGSGPAHRHVVDLADWDSHRQMVPAGQSGHLGHRNYRDQIRLWRDGGLHPLPWTDSAVRRRARNCLRLVPETR